MDQALKLKILTHRKMIFEGDVSQITLPGKSGEMTFLPGHTFLISALKSGLLRWWQGGREQRLKINSGWVEVNQAQTTALVSTDS